MSASLVGSEMCIRDRSNTPAPYQGEEAVLQAARNATCRQLLRASRRLDELVVRAKAAVEGGARQLTEAAKRLVEACRAERGVHGLGDESDDWITDLQPLPGRVFFACKAAARRVRE
eukprot:8505075-Alexandrium_andersonii.AAC.1